MVRRQQQHLRVLTLYDLDVVVVVQFVGILVVGVEGVKVQIVDGPPVRDRIERLRLQLVLLVRGVVHGFVWVGGW